MQLIRDRCRESLDLTLILPVYNERDSLPVLYEKLRAVLDSLGKTWEIVFIDDGSTDGSTEVLCGFQAQDPGVVVAIQRRNFGKSAALAAGFELACGEMIITLDADLQDDPQEIPRLLAKLDEGYDLVIGWKQRRQDPWTKRIPSKIANGATTLVTGLRIHDMNSGLKAYRAACAKHLTLYGDMHRYIPALAHHNGYRVTEIPVTHHKRQFGKTKYGPGRMLRGGSDFLTVLFLTNFRYRPLHLFGITGMVLLVMGFFVNAYLAIEWFQGMRPLSQRPLLLLGILLMLMGIQLLTMGLIGELLVFYGQRSEDPLHGTAEVHRASAADDVPVSSSSPEEIS
jgi:glycosyltransferase involved in cell wall biosynthesis